MILLATNKRDITTDFIVLELQRRGIGYLRLNTEDVVDYRIRMPGGDPDGLALRLGDREWLVRDFSAGYFRRPLVPNAPPHQARSIADYVVAEWSAVLRSIWNSLEGRWLNSPFAIQRAEDKPRQLAVAARLGLSVPRTLVTNDFDAATEFMAGTSVAKPMRHALLEGDDGPGSVIFTSRIDSLSEDRRAGFEMAPMILQQEIRKKADIRVTVVDDEVFAVSIDSQRHSETKVDWRRGSRTDVAHVPIRLPNELACRCVDVVKELQLRFAAIDLIEDRDGGFWFLEANPNGQWAWIERRTGLPITSAIVSALACS